MALKALIILLVSLLFLLPVSADPNIADPLAYPSVDALHEASIPARDRVDLARRVFGVTETAAPPLTAPSYAVGDQDTFNATNSTEHRDFVVTATLRVLGEHIALWVEDGAVVNDEDLQELADAFDQRVYPNVRAMWGSEANPGIDGDPRVHGLFARNLGETTAAYFASDHTYSEAVYPHSNAREMFFFNVDALAGGYSPVVIESIVAHEFQHMIRHNVQLNEDTWINEGMSTFTQFYLYGYMDTTLTAFLNRPETQLTNWNSVPAMRVANYGGAALFLTYLYDRFGIDAIHELSLDSSPRAWDSVDAVVKAHGAESADAVFADWAIVNLMHSLELPGTRTFNGQPAERDFVYDSLPPLITPEPVAEFSDLTHSYNGSVAPYATNYFAIRGVNGIPSLDISLNANPDAALIPAAINGQAAYSNRADLSDMRLTRQFDLSNVDTASLDYRIWYDFEESWDFGYLMASRDGVTWEALATNSDIQHDPTAITYGAGYTGSSEGWVDESASLDAYVGGTVYLRYEAITDDAVNRAGMVIDDVKIDAIGYAEDFENGLGDWNAEGWLLTDNRLPAHFFVQAVVIADSGVSVTRWEAQGDGDWTLPLSADARQVWLAVSPVVPVTTVPLEYQLSVDA